MIAYDPRRTLPSSFGHPIFQLLFNAVYSKKSCQQLGGDVFLPVWLGAVLTPLRSLSPLYATDLNAMKPLASLAPLRHCAKRVRKGRYEIMGTSHGGGEGHGRGQSVTTIPSTLRRTGGLYFFGGCLV